jgi:hypothetical protein
MEPELQNAPNPWRQGSDKAQGTIPDDYERDSEESEAQSEDWKSADEEEDAGHSATSFLIKHRSVKVHSRATSSTLGTKWDRE